MMFGENAALSGLFTSAFLSATVLPASSEVVFIAVINQYPHLGGAAWAVATLGNSLGSMVSYAMARGLPEKYAAKCSPKTMNYLQRYGAFALFFAWLPIVGDALPLAAGWLRMKMWWCVCWIILGKGARYGFIYYFLNDFQAA